MHKIGLVLSALFFLNVAFANNSLEKFSKRFEFIQNEKGETTYVKMKMFTANFSLAPYLKQVITDIKEEIKRLQQKDGQVELDQFLQLLEEGTDLKNEELAENIFTVRRSLEGLEKVDVDAIFAPVIKSDVLTKFKKELQDALNKYSLSVIASTQDARYFYKRNVTYEIVKRALDFAKKRFDTIPVLNLASFIIVKVHDLVLEQRTFHQNMLLHYLQTHSESELGLSKVDVDKIFSSIYESRIAAINYPESNRAAQTWARYGLNKFYAMVRGANNKLRRSQYGRLSSTKRYNYAFFETVEEGERIVKNLVDTKHSFSSKMATSYNYNKPESVQRFRTLLNLGQIGLGFLPIPGWLKGQVSSFIESYYVNQRLTEGALVGYFESRSNYVMAQKVVKQLGNPYLKI